MGRIYFSKDFASLVFTQKSFLWGFPARNIFGAVFCFMNFCLQFRSTQEHMDTDLEQTFLKRKKENKKAQIYKQTNKLKLVVTVKIFAKLFRKVGFKTHRKFQIAPHI